jgi:hypothetical protein
MSTIDGYRPQNDQVCCTSFSPSQRCCALLQYSVLTVPAESSPRPPSDSTSPLPSTVAEGYQWPEFMSLVRV